MLRFQEARRAARAELRRLREVEQKKQEEIYLAAVAKMDALLEAVEELDLPPYSKIIMTGFCACVAFFGIQVNSS